MNDDDDDDDDIIGSLVQCPKWPIITILLQNFDEIFRVQTGSSKEKLAIIDNLLRSLCKKCTRDPG
jgi:hypothetical protein